MALTALTTANFYDYIAENEIVIVDFWAQWCAPCLQFAEVLEKLAPKFPEVHFCKVNIEEETQLATDFNVRSIPFLVIFKKNIAIYAESGALSAEDATKLVEQAVTVDVSAEEK